MDINIKRIAELAMLEINEDESQKISAEMAEMAEMINMVSDLPELCSEQCNAIEMELREDEVISSEYSRDELLMNAPETNSGCFSVPRTVKH